MTAQTTSETLTVLVYGLGRSGGAAARLLRTQGHEVWTYDAVAPQGDELAALECRRTDAPLDVPADVCIAAPGVPYDAPDLMALRARGVETIGEVEWVYRTVAAEVIGITGTAGKTTTTHWVSHILTQAGLDAPAGGNVDPALSAVAEAGATLITELSSFQLERCPTLKPSVAVVLNLGEDHLDRHRSVAAYHAAKRNLLANLTASETFVYNQDDPLLRRWAEASSARCRGFSAYDEGAAAYVANGTLFLHGRPLVEAAELKPRHHLPNALAVALTCSAKGISREAIRDGLMSFGGVAGRYSLVLERAGVRFIDDSVATRTLAVQAALAATPAPVVWIVGGQDKGAELGALESTVRERVVRCIGIGEAGRAFTERVAAWTATSYIDLHDGDAAMLAAVTEAADTLREGGGTVLLAPLAASFDQFRDYQDRARAFRHAAAVVAETLTRTPNETPTETSIAVTDRTPDAKAEREPLWTRS